MKLAGKQALVTGAGRGIGKGCALELARAGADVVINDRPGSPDVQATAQEIRDLGRQCTVVESDIFSRSGCEELVERAIAAAGTLDILVSNPAYTVRCEFLDYDPDVFEKVIQGTLVSGFHVAQLTARQMVKSKTPGRIVFISSVQAAMPYRLSVGYNAAKAGLNHMARTIAVELTEHNIRVNVIEPGWIDTPGEHIAFDEETIREQGEKLPLKRLGTPADIGKAATFLCSDDADYVTGEVLRVDGGFWFKDC
ncbi:SDR family oxidoreductase [Symmachiella dynata]|uniref:SDR family NAD(P)-dependent oxidoreductase n=1 Tax=Symmachiella dynata TaxID=2527995 RepID=UPI0030EB5119